MTDTARLATVIYAVDPAAPGPVVTPDEAVAIALSLAIGHHIGKDSQTVQFTLAAIRRAGWKIVPKDASA